VAGALLAGLAVRLWFGLGYWQHKPLTHDEQEYLVLALNLGAGRGFVREFPGAFEGPSVERFARAPLYPAVLAAIFTATGQPADHLPAAVPRSVQVAQACVGVLTIWIIAVMARRAMGPAAGAVAAWLAALYPPLVWSSAFALSEAVYTPLILGSALAAGLAIDRRTHASQPLDGRILMLAGGLAGLAALARSAAVMYVIVLAGWLAWRRRWRLALAFGLVAAVVVAPWTLRNTMVHGRPILVAADGGVNFWMGNHPLAIGEGDMAANPRIKAAHVEFRRPLETMTPEQREPYYYRAALAHLTAHPAQTVELVAKKAFYTFVPVGPSYTLHAPLYYWTTVLSYGSLLLLTLGGLPSIVRSPRPPRALGLLVLSSIVTGLIFFPQDRYRIPVIDPAVCVGASWLIWNALLRKAGGAARS
jgi:hypothetical protein